MIESRERKQDKSKNERVQSRTRYGPSLEEHGSTNGDSGNEGEGTTADGVPEPSASSGGGRGRWGEV